MVDCGGAWRLEIDLQAVVEHDRSDERNSQMFGRQRMKRELLILAGAGILATGICCAGEIILCGTARGPSLWDDNTNTVFVVESAVLDSNRVSRILATVEAGMYKWRPPEGDFVALTGRLFDFLVCDPATGRVTKQYFMVEDYIERLRPQPPWGTAKEEDDSPRYKNTDVTAIRSVIEEVLCEYDCVRDWTRLPPMHLDLSETTNHVNRRLMRDSLLEDLGRRPASGSGHHPARGTNEVRRTSAPPTSGEAERKREPAASAR